MKANNPLLILRDAHVYYGQIHALKGVSLDINCNEIVALIGANGAGKTTTLKAISGILPMRSGTIQYDGVSLNETPAHEIVRRGIVHVPEGRRIFTRLTVAENLRMGAFSRRDKAEIKSVEARVLQMFPKLCERYRQLGGTLSGGEQQMLAMARGLMGQPRLLLLDEPSMGLAPIMVDQVFKAIQEVQNLGVTILLVEQNAAMCLKVADRGYLLEAGTVVLSDTGRALIDNPKVIEVYLG